ncbi:hypothetical protein B1219_24735 [Pseudomonas ogarae]|nr:hypothetical protein B1219_24735 [Pseudomonas ogarae]OPG78615.1 hypothetical protein B1218_14675 [Pseudomonas ogarae]
MGHVRSLSRVFIGQLRCTRESIDLRRGLGGWQLETGRNDKWEAGTAMLLWRGSLLPLGCEATPLCQGNFAPAAQSSGSKLPRHGVVFLQKNRRTGIF